MTIPVATSVGELLLLNLGGFGVLLIVDEVLRERFGHELLSFVLLKSVSTFIIQAHILVLGQSRTM